MHKSLSLSFSLSPLRENSLLPFAAAAAAALLHVPPCSISQEHMVWLIGAKAAPAQQLPCFCPPASADAPRQGPPCTSLSSPDATPRTRRSSPDVACERRKCVINAVARGLRKAAIAGKVVEYFSYRLGHSSCLLFGTCINDNDIFSPMLLKLFSIYKTLFSEVRRTCSITTAQEIHVP